MIKYIKIKLWYYLEKGDDMDSKYINLTLDNLETEHLCCAISDKKHQAGVNLKKEWLKDRLKEGHVFRKLDQKGKVFIEFAPLEKSWVPIVGENYMYIYCLWVSGSFKGHGHANDLLEYCISDTKKKGKSGICILSSKKKIPFLSDRKFMIKYGFEVVDSVDNYELLALSFDGRNPSFSDTVHNQDIEEKILTLYYSKQCPYTMNCVDQVRSYCYTNNIEYKIISVDSLEQAKSLPCIFNNWATFYDGKFKGVHLLNETYLKKQVYLSI